MDSVALLLFFYFIFGEPAPKSKSPEPRILLIINEEKRWQLIGTVDNCGEGEGPERERGVTHRTRGQWEDA
jgi:hypothetical protein